MAQLAVLRPLSKLFVVASVACVYVECVCVWVTVTVSATLVSAVL